MPGEEKKVVLVTGGTGYIGSHTVLELLEAGYEAVVLDVLSNSGIESIKRVEKMCNKKIPFEKVNLVDCAAVDKVFSKYKIHCVIHLAALKSVGESVKKPLDYYENNVTVVLSHALFQVMSSHNVRNLVFSSSCTVYGTPHFLPLTEEHPIGDCVNPYGASKFFAEIILKDLCRSDPNWNVVSLRYFNPIGAHPSGDIGEHPSVPYVTQVALGQRPHVNVFGSDYNTPDGTGIRDYIHIVDLAWAHIISIQMFEKNCGLKVYNIGTGKGYSVLEIIREMEKASGRPIPYKLCPRREGDTPMVFADAGLAARELGWKAKFGLDKMCEDQWRWQTKNPHGYA
ncbi:unnamed protein product [Echinostoma caproni]|uniref:UDP-glucose 4-epimerase n=1 Tax=Echinostoma caproni TaxID=27848 RepID=A0A183A5E3_9TREM|nr:unnamed protein product [Echinostoma caproni]